MACIGHTRVTWSFFCDTDVASPRKMVGSTKLQGAGRVPPSFGQRLTLV